MRPPGDKTISERLSRTIILNEVKDPVGSGGDVDEILRCDQDDKPPQASKIGNPYQHDELFSHNQLRQ